MLFNSPHFVFIFLPATIATYSFLGRTKAGGVIVLIAASAIFYGQWSYIYLLLLIALMSTNYLIGKSTAASEIATPAERRHNA
jgi:hypothetical protein